MSAREPRSGKEFYHVRVKPGDISGYVLLPGDPGRVPIIAELWDEGWEVGVWKNLFGVKILIYRPRSG